MGRVISLERYRRRRDAAGGAFGRLDRAVERLDPLVHQRAAALTPTIERELRVIARAVAEGAPLRAAERAERLAGILEHPAASG
ncbi:MAG TPA: hypothetical protein VK646_11050 [Actinomycetota bacterium]|nr:hypothetical protein [Actinomycetota bacterium]